MQQHHRITLQRRAITGTQIVLVMAILAIGATTLTIFLNQISRTRQTARCQFNLQALQTGFTNYALTQATTPPLPTGMYGPDNDGPLFQTSSANLHITLLNRNYIKSNFLVCPGEKNPLVNVFDADENPIPNTATFRTDIDAENANSSWSNLSYANRSHPDPVGVHSQPYQSFERATTIRFGDRAPQGGIPNPSSYANQLHGSPTTYTGNFVFADNHVETLTQESPNQTTSLTFENLTYLEAVAEPAPIADTIFTPQASPTTLGSTDQFLAIFRVDPTNPQSLTPIWD